jgi:hypothetical protein
VSAAGCMQRLIIDTDPGVGLTRGQRVEHGRYRLRRGARSSGSWRHRLRRAQAPSGGRRAWPPGHRGREATARGCLGPDVHRDSAQSWRPPAHARHAARYFTRHPERPRWRAEQIVTPLTGARARLRLCGLVSAPRGATRLCAERSETARQYRRPCEPRRWPSKSPVELRAPSTSLASHRLSWELHRRALQVTG